MADKKKNIESLFREGFSDYQPQPSAETWRKLHRKLRIRNFLRFNLSSLNIFYSGIFIATVIAGITFLYSNPQSSNTPFNLKNAPLIKELKPNKKTKKHDTQTLEPKIISIHPNNQATQSTKTTKEENLAPASNGQDLKIIDSADSVIPIKRIENSGFRHVDQPDIQIPPIALFTSEFKHACAPCQIQFKNNSINAISWEWSFGDGGSSKAKDPAYIYDEPGTYYVTLTAVGEDYSLCTYTEEIVIHPVPEVNFSMDINGKPGEGQPVYFYNYSKGAEIFSWNFGDGGTSDLRDPSWLYNEAGNYNIKLKAVSENGCADSMIIENAFLEENPEIIFPNIFSPNLNGSVGGYYSPGESNNDVFHPYTAEEPVEYQLRIFNRKGNLIFESNDLHKGWDGYYKEELQPQGVYVWKLRGKYGNGKSFVRMGDVTLLHQR
jgi:gliding motility-associated-like protein